MVLSLLLFGEFGFKNILYKNKLVFVKRRIGKNKSGFLRQGILADIREGMILTKSDKLKRPKYIFLTKVTDKLFCSQKIANNIDIYR